MKNTIIFIFAIVLILTYSSCKDAIEDGIDCTVESAFLSVKTEIDTEDPLTVHFTFVNADTIDNRFNLEPTIKWEFGDGNEESTQGLETTHTFALAGTYKAGAYYTLRKGDASCSGKKENTFTLE